MTRSEIIDAQPWHCGQMARRLRREHRDIILSLGYRVHHELRDQFEWSSYRKAWLIDGRLAALGGVHGTTMSPDGVIWLALSEEALCFKIAILKEARRQIAYVMQTRRILAASTLFKDWRSARFAEALGFEQGEPVKDEHGNYFLTWAMRGWPPRRAPIARAA